MSEDNQYDEPKRDSDFVREQERRLDDLAQQVEASYPDDYRDRANKIIDEIERQVAQMHGGSRTIWELAQRDFDNSRDRARLVGSGIVKANREILESISGINVYTP